MSSSLPSKQPIQSGLVARVWPKDSWLLNRAVRDGADPAAIIAGAATYNASVPARSGRPAILQASQTWVLEKAWGDDYGVATSATTSAALD